MYSEESSMIPGVYNMFDGMFYTFGHLQNCPPGLFSFAVSLIAMECQQTPADSRTLRGV